MATPNPNPKCCRGTYLCRRCQDMIETPGYSTANFLTPLDDDDDDDPLPIYTHVLNEDADALLHPSKRQRQARDERPARDDHDLPDDDALPHPSINWADMNPLRHPSKRPD